MSEIVHISVQIRLAKGKDLLIAKGHLKNGQIYYVLNDDISSFSGPHTIDVFHSYEVMKSLFKKNRVYLPIVESSDFIQYRLKQTNLKTHREENKIQILKN